MEGTQGRRPDVTFVLDASVTLSWCFRDEASPESLAILDRLENEPALVPSIWPLEVANILAVAERRRRIVAEEISEFVGLLARLTIRLDESTGERGLTEILALARDASLSSYDAAYLDLALRAGLPLATRDKALAEAARRAGVTVMTG